MRVREMLHVTEAFRLRRGIQPLLWGSTFFIIRLGRWNSLQSQLVLSWAIQVLHVAGGRSMTDAALMWIMLRSFIAGVYVT